MNTSFGISAHQRNKGKFRSSLVPIISGLLISHFAFAQVTPPAVFSGSVRLNYLRTWEALAPETDPINLIKRPATDVRQTTDYFDGLGRQVQTVIKQQSPLLKDFVVPTTFDSYGREVYRYLPFVSNPAIAGDLNNNGEVKVDPFQQEAAFSAAQYPGETFFYDQKVYEATPLNRVLTEYQPGNSWVGATKGTQSRSLINTTADNVQMWTIDAPAGSIPVRTAAATYAQGKLLKNVSTNEEGKMIIEFKNESGQIILSKVQQDATADNGSYSGWSSTYMVYDDFGNLRFVIPPAAVAQVSGSGWAISQALADGVCFRYEYDALNRKIISKAPGAAEVWMVYDALDRLVMTQDGNNRGVQWFYTIYDNLSRITSTGVITDTHDRAYHAGLAQASVAYPNLSGYTFETYSDTFYDTYSWLSSYTTPFGVTRNTTFDANFLPASSSFPYARTLTQSPMTIGRRTGTRTKVLGTSTYLYSIEFYDDKGRVIQEQATNYLGGTDIITTQFDFAGRKLRTFQKSGPTALQHTVLTKYVYDHAGRVTSITKNVDNVADQLVATKTYDELGRVRTNVLGNTLETLTFEYNIRQWLLGINRSYLSNPSNTASWFGMELAYDKTTSSSYQGSYAVAQLTGNIAGAMWRSKGDGQFRKYDFSYDPSRRMLKANFNQLFGTTWGTVDPNNASNVINFSEMMGNGTDLNTAYDPNGNLKALKNWGIKTPGSSPAIDDLTYYYIANSNKLQSVMDQSNDVQTKLGDFRSSTTYMQALGTKTASAVDYAYDNSGNLVKDLNKDIGTSTTSGIQYNTFNLPTTVSFQNGSSIKMLYDPTGKILQKTVVDNTVTGKTTTITITYISNSIYASRTTSPVNPDVPDYTTTIKSISQEEGRIRYVPTTATTGNFFYDFFIKDQSGSVRMVLTTEKAQDIYPAATLEGTGQSTDPIAVEQQKFFTINTGSVVASSTVAGITAYQNNNGNPPVNNNPNCNNTSVIKQTDNSQKLYLINGSAATKTGLGITIRVMSGDKVDIFGKSYYTQTNAGGAPANVAVLALDLIAGLLGTPASPAAGHATSGQIAANGPGTVTPLNTFISNHDKPASETIPRAYINYILFDEQFNYVASGMSQVGSAGVVKSHYADLALQAIPVTKNGYLYAYFSNESPVNVYFDNLQLIHTHGPLIEETHYYPFGEAMAGISSKMLRPDYFENQMKFQGQLYSPEIDFDVYQFSKRTHDPQIGRFMQIDPLADQFSYNSPYAFAENKLGFGKELEGAEIVPYGTGYFNMTYTAPPAPSCGACVTPANGSYAVGLIPGALPSPLKNASGQPTFTPAQAHVTPNGRPGTDNSSSPTVSTSLGTPYAKNPEWPFKNDEMDEDITPSTRVPESLKPMTEAMKAPQEVFKYFELAHDKKIWDANLELDHQSKAFVEAISLVDEYIAKNKNILSAQSQSARADLINFVYDGNAPVVPFRLQTEQEEKYRINIIKAALDLLNRNGITVDDATRQTYLNALQQLSSDYPSFMTLDQVIDAYRNSIGK